MAFAIHVASQVLLLSYQHLGLSVSLNLRNEKMFVSLYVNENLN
nr:MAG TPA: hypothetical protein [Caudoviricetes sp.]